MNTERKKETEKKRQLSLQIFKNKLTIVYNVRVKLFIK